MGIEFRTEAPVGDAELAIVIDMKGLAALLKGLEDAVAAPGQRQRLPEAGAFGNVGITFVEPERKPPSEDPLPEPVAGDLEPVLFTA